METTERSPWRITGTVVRGKGAGHRHGLPTANIAYAPDAALPPHGVYGGYATVEGERRLCVTNVGLRPSDDDSPLVTVEALLLDFDGDLYGKKLTVELLFFLRGIRKFPGGLDEVREQVRRDAAETRRRLDAPDAGTGDQSSKEQRKMGVLSNCEPKKVFEFFERLSSVPHGSGNTRQISDLCVAFAAERGLEHYQDELNNVIIIKPATPGYETAEPVILQGHLDMVCAKTDDCPLDMAREGLRLWVDGDWVRAKDTSLGGDNAIAVAIALAVLDSDTLAHPRLEAVFTVEEETGMDGARGLDVSKLRGRRMLNLDSEDEGVFTAGCAGGVRVNGVLPARRETLGAGFVRCRLEISGLMGGHSGVDIGRGRASANQLMGRLLHHAALSCELRLCELAGGQFDNVITLAAAAEVAVPTAQQPALAALAAEFEGIFQNEYAAADPGVRVSCRALGAAAQAVTREDSLTLLTALLNVPQGVQEMSQDVPGMVQTSLNLGIVRLDADALRFGVSVRSSIPSQKEMLVERLRALVERLGGTAETHGDYPAWAFRRESPLRELALEVYRELTGREGVVATIHAGLECGLFAEKLPGLDCISMGPNLPDVHSVRERLSISSTAWLWEMVCEILRRSK